MGWCGSTKKCQCCGSDFQDNCSNSQDANDPINLFNACWHSICEEAWKRFEKAGSVCNAFIFVVFVCGWEWQSNPTTPTCKDMNHGRLEQPKVMPCTEAPWRSSTYICRDAFETLRTIVKAVHVLCSFPLNREFLGETYTKHHWITSIPGLPEQLFAG